MSAFLPLLNKLIPIGLAVKGLEKVDPRLKTFFTGAFASGYGADEAMDFLRTKFENPEHERLEEGSKRGSLRPDEAAGLQQIRKSQDIKNNVKKGVALGAGLAGGAASLLLGGNKGARAIRPEVLPAEQKQMQIPYQAQRAIEEKPRAPIPGAGDVITPPISPEQEAQSRKNTAMQKINSQRQKKSLVQEELERFEQGYGKQPQQQGQDPNAMLLAAIQELKRIRGQ